MDAAHLYAWITERVQADNQELRMLVAESASRDRLMLHIGGLQTLDTILELLDEK